MNKSPNSTISWVLFLVLAFTWGSSFILMKRGLDSFTSEQVACLRIIFAFVFLFPLVLKDWKKAEFKKHGWNYFMVGFFGNLLPAFLFTKAQTGISSSTAGILNALTPLFTLIVAVIWFKSKFNRNQIIGVIIGFAGAVALLSLKQGGKASAEPVLGWLVVLATICYAISLNVIKNKLSGVNSVTITSFAFFSVGPLAFVYLFTTPLGESLVLHADWAWSLGYIALLGVWGTAMAVILYNVLIKSTSILFASSVTYLIPGVALMWGVLDGEEVFLGQILCIVSVLVGVYLVNRPVR